MTWTTSQARRGKLGTLHQLKAAAGLDDDAYRDKLELVTGSRSAKELSEADLDKAIASFHVKQKANHPHTAKVKALWIACFNLGAIDNGRDPALDAFVRHQTGKERLAFVTPTEANKVTEALKAIAGREGFVVPPSDQGGLAARRALLRAQWHKLVKLGAVHSYPFAMEAYANAVIGGASRGLDHYGAADLDALARAFGNKLRKALKGTPA